MSTKIWAVALAVISGVAFASWLSTDFGTDARQHSLSDFAIDAFPAPCALALLGVRHRR